MGASPRSGLSALKPLYLNTDLVAGRQPCCAILTPADSAHRAVADRLTARLRDLTGADIPVTDRAAPLRQHVIALGQMAVNPLLERLYWSRYHFADALWPGLGGWSIQTVHNPYPWTSGRNVLILGGSDAQGVGLAAEAFLQGIRPGPDLTLPPIHRVQLPPPERRPTGHTLLGRNYTAVTVPERDLSEGEARALVQAEPEASLLAFQEGAARYLGTGHLAYLRAARNVLLRMCEIYEADPERKMTWPEETNARYIFAMWDAVEETPLFTDEQRLRISRMLLAFLHTLVGVTSDYEHLEERDTILWNHTTFPLLGLYWGARYFKTGYGLEGMDAYLKKAAAAFRGQERSWKPQCDADGYLTLTIGHTIEYALAEGRMDFFESGNIERYADYLMGICDNRGRAPGFGDSGLHADAGIPLSGVPCAFWYTQNPAYLGYLNLISGGEWPNPYHRHIAPESPDRLVGVRAYPLDRQVYDYTARRPYYNEPSGPPNIPCEQAFDKIAFRAGLGPEDQYFILDGYGRGKHHHYDTNAILKLTHGGEDWLIDADYLVRNTTDHNMLSIVRNGRVERLIPECAGLLCCGDLPGYGLTETVVRDYNGVDWYRDIFWKKGGWIVVMDRLQAGEAGEYRLDAVWKTPDRGEVRLDGSTLTIRRRPEGCESPRTFTIHNASGAACTLRRRIGAPGPVLLLTQRQAARLAPGGRRTILNLLYLHPPGGPEACALEKLDERAARLRAPEDCLMGAGPFEAGGFAFNAALYCLGPEKLALGGATEFRCGSIQLASKTPIALEIDFASGEAALSTSRKTEVTRRGGSPLQIQPGTHRIALNLPEGARDALADALETTAAPPAPAPVAAQPQGPPAPVLTERWRIDPEREPEPIRAVHPWNAPDRFGGPSSLKLLVCQGRKLKCYAPGGVIHWTFTTKAQVRCAAVADVDGDGCDEILLGGEDERVHLLDGNGHELRSHRLTEQLIVGQGGTRQPFVNALLAADFDGDGTVEIVAGCTNSQISMFDPGFSRAWNRGGIYHGVRKLLAADLDRDGKAEILAADHYGSVHAIAPSGDYLGRAYAELGDVAFDIGDLDGDGHPEIVVGSGTGVAAAFNRAFERLWTFDNYGYNTREVLCHDLDGDGKAEVLIASDTGYVYALGGDGALRWQADLGAPVLTLAPAPAPDGGIEFAAGLASGRVLLLNAEGRVAAACPGSAPAALLLCLEGEAPGRRQLVVVDTDERLRVFS